MLYPDFFRVLKNKCWNLDNYCGIMENSKKTIEDLKNFTEYHTSLEMMDGYTFFQIKSQIIQ